MHTLAEQMPTWFQEFSFTSGDCSAWLSLTPENSFHVIAPSLAPGPLPQGLLEKCDAILLMRSGSRDQEYVVANLYRRDGHAIDQMPFGSLIVSGSGSAGILTHHGDWQGRTFSGSNITPSFYRLSSSGSGAYSNSYATLGLPSKVSGSIFEATPQSNILAFQAVVDELNNRTGSAAA